MLWEWHSGKSVLCRRFFWLAWHVLVLDSFRNISIAPNKSCGCALEVWFSATALLQISVEKMSPVEMTSGHQWRHSMTAPPDARWKPCHDASSDAKASSLVASAAVLFVLREKRRLWNQGIMGFPPFCCVTRMSTVSVYCLGPLAGVIFNVTLLTTLVDKWNVNSKLSCLRCWGLDFEQLCWGWHDWIFNNIHKFINDVD